MFCIIKKSLMNNLKKIIWQINKPIFAIENSCKAFGKKNEMQFTNFYDGSFENIKAFVPALNLDSLGDKEFLKRYSIKYPYIAGAMANGISSAKLVKTMAENNMLGFFGSAGLDIPTIQKNIIYLQNTLKDRPFGFNLIHSFGEPDHEMQVVKLYLRHNINLISAAAFIRMTPALVYYRVKGIYEDENKIIVPNNIIAKVSRIEVARHFFSPPPEKIIKKLLKAKLITKTEARLSQFIPMAYDITAEADSGGHTDNRPALSLLPIMLELKNEFMQTKNYDKPLCVGLAGGIATAYSASAAFSMGASYILTGSINQACVEADICDDVKNTLCKAQQADFGMAPSADMFELGAKVQVLKRGTMFCARANKLYKLYQDYESFEKIDEKTKAEIQKKYLQSDFEQAFEDLKDFFIQRNDYDQIKRAQTDTKHKMALVFRAYLGKSSKWAIKGDLKRKMDYQIWCGPSMGDFNQWAKSTFLESFENRKASEIAFNILFGACVNMRISILRAQGINLPFDSIKITPLTQKEILNFCS